MKTLVYCTAWLMVVCCLAVSEETSSKFVNGSEIKVMTAANRAIDGKVHMVVFREGTADGQPKVEKVTLKITNEFKPQPRKEYKLSDPIYKWDGKEGGLTDDGKEEEEVEFTTTEKSWGKEFKIKGSIEYKDIPLDPKNKEELPNQEGPAKADIKAVSPVVKVKSVTFRHGKENSSLPVAEDAEGKLVPTPEYQADAGDKETAILYVAESTPVIQVCFDVKPATLKMADVKIKGEVGKGKKSILKALTMEEADNQNFDANSKIPFKAAKLEKKVAMGNISHEFTITYKDIELTKKPDYSVEKAYVVLGKPIGPWEKKTPWKDVLNFVIEDCKTIGCQNFHSLLCAVKTKIGKGNYLPTFGQWLIRNQVLISSYLDGPDRTVNCSDAAVLTTVFSKVMGVNVDARYCYPFSNYFYHAYNIWNGKVYDAVFGGNDVNGTLNEEEYYNVNGVRSIVLYKNGVPSLYWNIPFQYIKKQLTAKEHKFFVDIPGLEGQFYECDPIVLYLCTLLEKYYQTIR